MLPRNFTILCIGHNYKREEEFETTWQEIDCGATHDMIDVWGRLLW